MSPASQEPLRRRSRSLCVLLLLLCAAGTSACGGGQSQSSQPLAVGEVLRTDLRLEAVSGASVAVADLLGSTPVVFYAWSVPCPCIANAEARVQALIEEFPSARWIAVAGEPQDTQAQLREQKLRFGSPYTVLRDPKQQLCTLLRIRSAGMTVLFDDDGRLVYRGPLDDDFTNGTGAFVREALTALTSGAPIPVAERPRTYGCYFSEPGTCRVR